MPVVLEKLLREPPFTFPIILVRTLNNTGICNIGQAYSYLFSLLSSLTGLPLCVTTCVTSLSKAAKRGRFLHLHNVGRKLVHLGLAIYYQLTPYLVQGK